MKFVKGISFFVIYPMIFMGAGFIAGVECTHFFYPGREVAIQEQETESVDWEDYVAAELKEEKSAVTHREPLEEIVEISEEFVAEVSTADETLSVDTEYILEETDIVSHTVVETKEKLPMKYVGMDREQFLVAMESYEAFPPLSEKERGFVGLEVLSFSRERVVVQMNYEYQTPGEEFYLAIRDHEVVVYKEDLETVYINTGILVDTLPKEIQLQLIQTILVTDEQELYDFLENYSS